MKTIIVPAGKRTRILHMVSDSIPQTVRFTALDAENGGLATGTVEIQRRPWFLPAPPERAPLQPENRFQKGFADVTYAITVTPDRDTRIVFSSRHFERHILFTVLIAVAVLGALSALLVPLFLS